MPSADDGHVALDDRLALGAELLDDLGADLLADRLGGRALRHPVDVPGDRADERDAHHAQSRGRGSGRAAWRRERVDDEEADLLLPDGPPGVLGQLPPDVLGERSDCRMNVPPSTRPLQRVGVDERLVVRGDHDLDVLELGVGDQHRLGAQRDVVVGRRAALLRAVLRCGLRVHAEHAGQDVGEQLAGGDGAVAADGVEADPHRRRGQQRRVLLGLQGHQLGLGVRRAQPRLDHGHLRRRVRAEELGAEVDQRCGSPSPCS
jgi:hypothetical protein